MNILKKIKLLFKPKLISVDYSNGKDYCCKVTYKIMDNKIYILDVKYF
jgi:hypothetical protein